MGKGPYKKGGAKGGATKPGRGGVRPEGPREPYTHPGESKAGRGGIVSPGGHLTPKERGQPDPDAQPKDDD